MHIKEVSRTKMVGNARYLVDNKIPAWVIGNKNAKK